MAADVLDEAQRRRRPRRVEGAAPQRAGDEHLRDRREVARRAARAPRRGGARGRRRGRSGPARRRRARRASGCCGEGRARSAPSLARFARPALAAPGARPAGRRGRRPRKWAGPFRSRPECTGPRRGRVKGGATGRPGRAPSVVGVGSGCSSAAGTATGARRTPNFSKSCPSTCWRTSGCSRRNVFAFSRPWPMRSPPKENQAPLFSTMFCSAARSRRSPSRLDALAVQDVELDLPERRRDLVLHDLHARAVADDVARRP